MLNKKEDNDIVIVNKFKENEGIDVKVTIENIFKMFYEIQRDKK